MLCSLLLKSVIKAREKLQSISKEIQDNKHSEVIKEGLFVLTVSTYEYMIIDILKYYLKCFPQKLGKEKIVFNKNDILNNQFRLLDNIIDEELRKLSYANIIKLLDYFIEVLSLDSMIVTPELKSSIIEIKASRNLLMHNDLVVNREYIERAGPYSRAENVGSKLRIDSEYLQNCLQVILEFNDVLEKSIFEKYSSYTKIRAYKELWQFLFDSPVMPFDDFWNVDFDNDKIISYKKGKYENHLSNSELMFLNIWRSHFHGVGHSINNFSMYSLSSRNQAKMLYLLSIFTEMYLD